MTKRRFQTVAKFCEDCGLKTHFLYGDLHEFPADKDGRMDKFVSWMSSCKDMCRVWYGPFECFIFAVNPEFVKIAVTNADSKDNLVYDLLRPWLGDGLLLTGGNRWIRQRRLLTNAFHFEILRPYCKIFAQSAQIFLDKLSASGGRSIDVYRLVSLMTLDSILRCAFSYESKCQTNENDPYIRAVYDLSECVTQRTRIFPYHNDVIFHLSPMGRRFRRLCHLVHAKSDATIKERRKELVRLTKEGNVGCRRKYLDFLDVLLEAKDEDGQGLNDSEIREEVNTFMFAGHDTTASAISWCLYNLAKYPEIQQKCQVEIDQLLQDRENGQLDWEDLNSLPFTTMCIKESLRMHPPVPYVARTLVKDITMPNGLQISKGTTISIGIIGLHHNSLYWPNPEQFDPTRFSAEKDRHSHAFIPFSAGPRNCLGQHFAMDELKVVVAMTLHQYSIRVDQSKPSIWVSKVVLRSLDGIHLHFNRR
ncbi:cytochrome P450 4A24-like [Amphiura filiformis]|uniref:cytochrome P450 4A24-like n=1 Tax=Amphiura filiformis TaxID=82378 RepID=UPI003B20D60D